MKFKPWKVIPIVIKALQIAKHLHDEHQASGKPLEEFVKDKLLNPDVSAQ